MGCYSGIPKRLDGCAEVSPGAPLVGPRGHLLGASCAGRVCQGFAGCWAPHRLHDVACKHHT
eukprot:4603114-Pyramimonas_sp.AAC.1